MPFTAQELAHISNSTLDFYIDKRKVFSQTLQDKPLLSKMRSMQKTFPGGKENLSVAVKGVYTTDIMGFTHDDEVTYANPANAKRANYPWKEIHSGISFTGTELKKDGVSIVDSNTGEKTSNHSGREMTALVNILEDKLEDMVEGTDRGMNNMYWQSGTQDAKVIPGIRSIILDDPTSAVTVGGIDQAANTWWRNRASLLLNAGTPANLVIIKKLQAELRQLRRYGSPKWGWFAGSDFITALENEIRSQGTLTDTGFTQSGKTDAGIADLRFKGNPIMYDPTLDDLGLSKYLYILDCNAIHPMVMDGEDMKRHYPSRPENKYVYYRAITYTGGLVCRQRNTSGVYSIA